MNNLKKKAWAQLVSSTDIETPAILIYSDKFIFGRNKECDLAFSGNKHISGNHCFLERLNDGNVWLHDTSTNGTLLNLNVKISKGERQQLQHGDEFHIVHKKTCPSDDIAYIFQDLKLLEEETTTDSDNTIDYSQTQADATIEDEEINEVTDEDLGRKRKCEDLTVAVSAKKMMLSPAVETQHVSEAKSSSSAIKEKPGEVKPQPKQESDEIEETLLCSICTELLHDCVSLQPCMHSYCGGCYSEWMERSNECPSCRVKVERINKNHIVNNLVGAYLKTKPEKRRSQSDLDELNWKNKITRDMLYPEKNSKGITTGSFEFESDDSEESDDDIQILPFLPGVFGPLGPGRPIVAPPPPQPPPVICRQCPNYKETNPVQDAMQPGTSGVDDPDNKVMPDPPPFSCMRNQNHVLCLCCYKPMPDRHAGFLRGENIPPQQCKMCYRAFCHAYWGCKNTGCNGCIAKLKDMNFGKKCLTSLILDNPYESNILQEHLTQQGLSVKHLLGDCLAKLVVGDYTCTNIDQLTDGINTVVCYSCGLKTFRELAYLYRKDIPQNQLPAGTSRPDCYWGKNCRTQRNKPDHAKRFNHICEQTRTGL